MKLTKRKPETIAEAIDDTIKTGRRWGPAGFPDLQYGTPEEMRNHFMSFINNWKNSPVFIENIERQFDTRHTSTQIIANHL